MLISQASVLLASVYALQVYFSYSVFYIDGRVMAAAAATSAPLYVFAAIDEPAFLCFCS